MSDFIYDRKPRPTRYQGIEFRSELEAAWAAFMDLRGIFWEYEPLAPLVTWRPDFVFRPKAGGKPINVEVKPFRDRVKWDSQIRNICQSYDGDFVVTLLGESPLMFESSFTVERKGVKLLIAPINFGPIENVRKDWNRAKNRVRYKRPKL